MQNIPSKTFLLVQIAVVAVFAGRSYQHLFWDAPYREILWDPFYTKWLVEHLTPLTWDTFVTHPKGDIWIQNFVLAQGWGYAICGLTALFIKKLPAWCRWILVAGALNLVLLALIYMKDKFYHFGQFFEYSLQFSAPLFLYYFTRKNEWSKSLLTWMKVAIALTFICHGLYAIGYYPRPEKFMTMTQNILGLDVFGVNWFLTTAGILDFIVAVLIFVKNDHWSLAALWYTVIWGFLTSMARIFGNFYWDFPWESLNQWVYEVVFRFPHFLIPLALISLIKSKK
ncbi:MAG: hypothetical protein R2825_19840 [Saprospiraceae bacterium]